MRAGDDGDAHHQRDQRRRQPDARSPDGGERAEGAVDDADEKHRQEGDRRIREERSEIDRDPRQRLRRRGGGERCRKDGEGEEDRTRHEQRRGQRVARADAELSGGDAEIGHRHVDRENNAAALVGGALVKPAFDDHERAGEEEPGGDAKKDPRERNDEDAVQKDDDRGAGGRAGERADMADAADDDRRGQAAEHEAGRPAGAEQAELAGRKTLRRAAERHQKRMQPVPGEQERRREEQRENGDDLTGQGVPGKSSA